jgi:rhodanese-related sulfurtransferase
MADRIAVEEARGKVTGAEALLVCAYEDASKCDRIKLEGAISLQDLRKIEDSLPKDREIIFYCA